MTIYQVPKAMQEKYSGIVAQTDQFAAKHLNAEYQQLSVDVRHMPREVQEIAYQKGLIPFIPADRN
jgi:hypothetical protein